MIDALANLHFIRPAWLLLLPVAVAAWWIWRRSVEPLRGWRAQVDTELLDAMRVDDGDHRDRSARWLLTGWLLAVVAIAGPTWRREPNPFAADAAPLVVLLKADESMEQAEPSPSPLERAQLKIADLADVRVGQPLGLIAYAGSAHLVLPPTRDTEVVAEMAAEIDSDVMPEPGDRLDLAIREAGKLLAGEEAGGTLLVIADSVGTDAESLVKAHREAGAYAIQFLDLRDDESVRAAASALGASVVPSSPDDGDVSTITRVAARRGVVGVAGEGERWQEAGYWLVPLLAILVALSFRRTRQSNAEVEP